MSNSFVRFPKSRVKKSGVKSDSKAWDDVLFVPGFLSAANRKPARNWPCMGNMNYPRILYSMVKCSGAYSLLGALEIIRVLGYFSYSSFVFLLCKVQSDGY